MRKVGRPIKHNLSFHPLYNIWHGMKNRCYLPSNSGYKNYGERGIIINSVWKKSFKTFYNWAIKNGYRKDLTIDRINNDGNYTPSNCRFVNRTMQQINKRSHKNSSSNYVGVNYSNDTRYTKPWRTALKVNDKKIDLGRYKTEIKAALARDRYILENNLKHRLNILVRSKENG